MKKKPFIALILLTIVILFAAGDAIADESGLFHVALNDKLYDLHVRPVFVGNPVVIYLPSSLFAEAGIALTYNFENGMVSVSDGFSRIDFASADGGQAYDALGSQIAGVSAQVAGGQVYLPIAFLCDLFGIGYSVIPGVGYGNIIRLNTGSLIDDKTFLSSYTNIMRERYEKYFAVVPPTPSPSPSPDIDRSDVTVYLLFTGIPTSSEILDVLDTFSVKTCFFLTSDEVTENPEMVRRVVASGHNAGVTLQDGVEFRETADLIFEASRYLTFLAIGSDLVTDERPDSVAFWSYDISVSNTTGFQTLTTQIDAAVNRITVRFTADIAPASLGRVLNYLVEGRYNVRPVREID